MVVNLAKRLTEKTQLFELAAHLGISGDAVDSLVNAEKTVPDAALLVLNRWGSKQPDSAKAFHQVHKALSEMGEGRAVVEVMGMSTPQSDEQF